MSVTSTGYLLFARAVCVCAGERCGHECRSLGGIVNLRQRDAVSDGTDRIKHFRNLWAF